MPDQERTRQRIAGWIAVIFGLMAVWQLVVLATGAPPYILPSPLQVLEVAWTRWELIGHHSLITALEIVLGLAIGTMLGVVSALFVGFFRSARRWLLPVLVASQAVPVFALAPILVLWLGYGLVSKVAMASLIIFFPVSSAFLDGLRRTEPGWLDLASTMLAAEGTASGGSRRRRVQLLVHVQIPAALPALASGLRVATAVAPIGAVVGEWVGSSSGLGYLMLHANGRMQIDLMFAALFCLAAFSVTLWFTVDALLRRVLPWQPDSFHPDSNS